MGQYGRPNLALAGLLVTVHSDSKLTIVVDGCCIVLVTQMVSSSGVSNVSLASIESVAADYQGLSTLTTVHSDASSISQLKRISRDIFDHLAEHLGNSFHNIEWLARFTASDTCKVRKLDNISKSPVHPPCLPVHNI